jgi:hypothetical protein
MVNFSSSAASNSCCLAASVEKLLYFEPVSGLLQTRPMVGRWLARAIRSIKYEFMFEEPIYRARKSVFLT